MEYETITLQSWSQIAELEVEYSSHVYRGQWDAGWSLTSSLLRRCRDVRHDDDHITDAERGLLSAFQRRLHHYETNLPCENDFISWLAIMQHHGACTRLIDFSHSFYVALFFAMTLPERDACVWSIEELWLHNAAQEFAASLGFEVKPELEYLERWSENQKLANEFLKRHYLITSGGRADSFDVPRGAFIVEPKKQIQRLAIQQGLFVMPADPKICLLDNMSSLYQLPEAKERFISETRGLPATVRKIVIPASMNETVRMHLAAMNITAESLLPGIEGFARSVMEREVYPISLPPKG